MTGSETVPAPVAKGTYPLGATRCAQRLAERLGLPVHADDIKELARAAHLQVADQFTADGVTYDLYALEAIDALDAELVAATITDRAEWLARSISTWDASQRLGWKHQELTQVLTGGSGAYGRDPALSL